MEEQFINMDQALGIDTRELASKLLKEGSIYHKFTLDETPCTLQLTLRGGNLFVSVTDNKFDISKGCSSLGDDFEDADDIYYPLANAIANATKSVFPYINLIYVEL